ncbi:MAG: formimidoylglutamate deiminase [Rhodoferax sp.]
MARSSSSFFAAQAWIDGAWARDVLLTVDRDGKWCGVQANAAKAGGDPVIMLKGPVLPGLVNAHSHAFQRGMAGLTERLGDAGASDDFWSWRDRMYSVARRVRPAQLEAIAAFLYAELLAGGYTQVCEFHYLHNAADGEPYADPVEMSLALVRAAQTAGIGLTLLPTLYMRSGFWATGLREDQRRFASTPDSVLRLVEDLRAQAGAQPNFNAGVALHSLRAAGMAAIKEVSDHAQAAALPVHIHIAEQTQEVQDCIAATGMRPIECLLSSLPLDARWNLVHATHASAAELQAVSQSGACIVICPSTEANLGDGVFDLPAYAGAGGNWSIGSDSHVARGWTEELRLLEYSQRLTQRRRNVAASSAGVRSSAAALWQAALAGGASGSGQALGAIKVGHRADFLVLDGQSAALLGVPADYLLDALVFSSPDARFAQVYVAGRQRLAGPELRTRLAQDFARTLNALWA